MTANFGWTRALGVGVVMVAGLGLAALASRHSPGAAVALSLVIGLLALMLGFAAAAGALSFA